MWETRSPRRVVASPPRERLQDATSLDGNTFSQQAATHEGLISYQLSWKARREDAVDIVAPVPALGGRLSN